MNENEEFEFRLRLEQEAGEPGIMKQVGDTVMAAAKLPYKALTAIGEKTNEVFDAAGEKTAEAIGGMGMPKTGAVAGTTISMIPDAIGSFAGVGPASSVKAAPGVGRVAKLAASGVEKVTGIEADAVTKLFQKPLELFLAPTKKDVSIAYAKSELKKAVKTIVDKAEEGTMTDGAYVNRAKRALVKSSPVVKEQAGDMLLKGRQALDAQIDSLKAKLILNPKATATQNKIKAKQAFREEINLALDKIAPNHRAADAVNTRQSNVDPFRRLTLPGKISLNSTEGILRAVPGLPSAVGVAASTIGAAGKAAGAGYRYTPKLSLITSPFANKDK
jgi:hypothetical protein